jgi:hypothetical protein
MLKDILHSGFAVQFNSPIGSRLGRLPKEESLNQFEPLVEFAFDSAQGSKTFATSLTLH